MTDNEDPQGCTDKLRALLTEAQDAASKDDAALRRSVSQKLTQFIIDSTPNNTRILALDNIAGEASKGLLRMNIDDRLASISASNVDLAKLTKQFAAAAANAADVAGGLRLERLQSAIDVLNEGVESLRQLKDVLDNGTDTELIDSLMKAEAAIVNAREGLRGQT
ncbi:MAG TPA: hypothetical protein VN289_17405 [Paraburkholderia sp.]|jgi:hypothetical protein|nr:hypothetical protein [Paraburkholderia sp.]